MQRALRQVGFDPAAPIPRKPAGAGAAKPSLSAIPDERLTLRRREWLADRMERQRALSPIASGLLRAGLEFKTKKGPPKRPLIHLASKLASRLSTCPVGTGSHHPAGDG
ncbi:MAG: hypothetical protein QHC40_10305 [Sphingobium sp.]|nr:hypothetical protein [Sphingobium sp.]